MVDPPPDIATRYHTSQNESKDRHGSIINRMRWCGAVRTLHQNASIRVQKHLDTRCDIRVTVRVSERDYDVLGTIASSPGMYTGGQVADSDNPDSRQNYREHLRILLDQNMTDCSQVEEETAGLCRVLYIGQSIGARKCNFSVFSHHA